MKVPSPAHNENIQHNFTASSDIECSTFECVAATKSVSNTGQLYQVTESESDFNFKATGHVSDTLDDAFERYSGILFRSNRLLQKAQQQAFTESIKVDQDLVIDGADVNVLSSMSR